MSVGNHYEGIKHVVRIHTNNRTKCEHCDTNFEEYEFTKAINHHIEQHGYKLLYVGTESAYFEGNAHYYSVAILGK